MLILHCDLHLPFSDGIDAEYFLTSLLAACIPSLVEYVFIPLLALLAY